ncbi:hypothetical protein ZIOFF_006076 [Zingiber officinale]|uniref:Uncharacterized protein n=1 Tax=Zingiber officinale TaxID=94328 RepID=A0A8J5HP98_ZINOF|nr:hypothetical protein ZIOFF_006076 [Zingiber officinale]
MFKDIGENTTTLDLVDIFILKLDVVIGTALVLLVKPSGTLVEADVLREFTASLKETGLVRYILEDDVRLVVLVVTEADEDDVPVGNLDLLVHLTTDVVEALRSVEARCLAAAVSEHPEDLGVLLADKARA